MAGMEHLEIRSKSYLIRWVNVAEDHTISWSIQPHKKSINFGIFRHPGGSALTPSNTPAPSTTFESPPTPGLSPDQEKPSGRRTSSSRNETSTAVEKLLAIGLTSIKWVGKCEADKVTMGSYDIPRGHEGMYALVFDNTFSKQIAKSATFVLLTYPTNAPPQTTHHHLHNLQAGHAGSSSSLGSKPSTKLAYRSAIDSTDSLQASRPISSGNGVFDGTHHVHSAITTGDHLDHQTTGFFNGVLYKRRRRRHQGYAKRFFSLDFTSSTLSYYHDQGSSALRGSIPLSLAAIGANKNTREISVDSGAEVWHLRAANQKDFEAWTDALENAATTAGQESATKLGGHNSKLGLTVPERDVADERDWKQIESLISRVAGTRDAVRRLTDSTHSAGDGLLLNSLTSTPTESGNMDYFQDKDKRPSFWKRKTSSGRSNPSLFQRRQSAHLTPQDSSTLTPAANPAGAADNGMHKHCVALLKDLDSVVGDFSRLVTHRKQRQITTPASAVSRHSIESFSSGEFFDAEDGRAHESQLLSIEDNDGDKDEEETFTTGDEDSDLSSGEESQDHYSRALTSDDDGNSFLPTRPKSLTPLPLDPIRRRTTIPAATVMPPSLIGFLRKNVGKDLSTIAMPVSANEPLSLLQRIAEQFEYTSLLDRAPAAEMANGERLLHVATFAIASLANVRAKERAIRKPFNPLLGETYELVREDLGFRFLAEKICHRPVQMACQVESKQWTFMQAPKPAQKFWGKSAELNTDGRARVVLHETKEVFSWTLATCFLRNMIAGEKHIEPVGTMTIVNETNGQKAVATFKTKGMFGGRSEDVAVQAFGPDGRELPLGLLGKWTESLALTEDGGRTATKTVWRVGPLVNNAPARYGLPAFTASLNEITQLEAGGRVCPTDSRLRPDQRAAEEGDLDRAEDLKVKLEEAQRVRRREMEDAGVEWVPKWFERVVDRDEEIWQLKRGKGLGYWEERERGAWNGVGRLFDV